MSINTKLPAIFWGLYIIIFGLFKSGDKNGISLVLLLSYLTSFELFCRLMKTAPLIPYEIGKYASIAGALIALFNSGKKSYNGIAVLLLFLSLPSLLNIDISIGEYRNTLVFNYFGFISMVLLMIVFDRKMISFETDLKNIMIAFLLPVISIVIFLTIKSPDLSEMEFALGSNYEASGGFGPNQVATVMGAGFFISYIFFAMYGKISFGFGKFIVDTFFIIISCMIRGLLTFSRGGMFVGFFLILVFISFKGQISKSISLFKVSFFQIVILFSLLIFITYQINEFTDNQLFLRYQGETIGTQNMERDKDVDLLLSGRKGIIEQELELFYDNPLLGVGPGQSRFERIKRGYEDNNSHTEVTRMVAEHGVFGIAMAVIFLFYPLFLVGRQKDLLGRFIVGALCFIAIVTSFHSATRLLITPFFYALACANFNFYRK